MPSDHLILCYPLLLLPSIFPSIRVFSNESVFCNRRPKYWSFSFSISPSNEYSGLISFMIDWCDRLAIQGDQSLSLSCAPSLSHKWSYRFLSTMLKSHLSLFHNVILMISSIILLWSALKSFFWGGKLTDSELVENLFKDSKSQSVVCLFLTNINLQEVQHDMWFILAKANITVHFNSLLPAFKKKIEK